MAAGNHVFLGTLDIDPEKVDLGKLFAPKDLVKRVAGDGRFEWEGTPIEVRKVASWIPNRPGPAALIGGVVANVELDQPIVRRDGPNDHAPLTAHAALKNKLRVADVGLYHHVECGPRACRTNPFFFFAFVGAKIYDAGTSQIRE